MSVVASRLSPPRGALIRIGGLRGLGIVEDPRRTQLLTVAEEANRAGWWEEYADALPPEYMEFIGLEEGASSVAHWELQVVPGLSEDLIKVRDSKRPKGTVLRFTAAEWDNFVSNVRNGKFDGHL